MSFEKIRDQIVESMNVRSDALWADILGNATPAPYCVDDLEFQAGYVRIDIPKRTFSFRGNLSFWARLGASSEVNGMDASFNVPITGSGNFEFLPNGRSEVVGLHCDSFIDLFDHSVQRRVA